MAVSKSVAKKSKLLAEQIRKRACEELGLPGYSLPFIGPKYSLGRKRRIMVVYAYKIQANKSALRNASGITYNEFFYKKADLLLKQAGRLRVNPYVVEDSDFNLSYLLENVEKGMTCDDVVIHRFIPYPSIEGVDGQFRDEVYSKAVDWFVELLDRCQPTHVFIIRPYDFYRMDSDFRQYRRCSLQDVFDERYIIALYGSDDFKWESFVPMDEGAEFIPDCAYDLLSDKTFARVALEDPRLKPALYWNEEKVLYYGVDKNVSKYFVNNPESVKKLLLDESCPGNLWLKLIQPFENLRFGQILYTLLERIPCEIYNETEDRLTSRCKWISQYNRYIKGYSELLQKTRDIHGRAKIRSLSINLQYALQGLADRMRLSYDSKKLAEIRGYIEKLYEETDKLYAVRQPVSLVTKRQKMARSRSLDEWKIRDSEERETVKAGANDPPILYKPKKISQKQLDHLARIRKKRWPKK